MLTCYFSKKLVEILSATYSIGMGFFLTALELPQIIFDYYVCCETVTRSVTVVESNPPTALTILRYLYLTLVFTL